MIVEFKSIKRKRALKCAGKVNNFIPTFQVWYGDKAKEYGKIEDVMTDHFFEREALEDLAGKIDFEIL